MSINHTDINIPWIKSMERNNIVSLLKTSLFKNVYAFMSILFVYIDVQYSTRLCMCKRLDRSACTLCVFTGKHWHIFLLNIFKNSIKVCRLIACTRTKSTNKYIMIYRIERKRSEIRCWTKSEVSEIY